jgi:hypothetical protein
MSLPGARKKNMLHVLLKKLLSDSLVSKDNSAFSENFYPTVPYSARNFCELKDIG